MENRGRNLIPGHLLGVSFGLKILIWLLEVGQMLLLRLYLNVNNDCIVLHEKPLRVLFDMSVKNF